MHGQSIFWHSKGDYFKIIYESEYVNDEFVGTEKSKQFCSIIVDMILLF